MILLEKRSIASWKEECKVFYYPFWDMTYILLIPAFILVMYAQGRVQSTFARYLKVRAASGMTGAAVARQLLDKNGLHHVNIEVTRNRLGDHYDPRSQTLRLSPEIYRSGSLAALGVAAHETGHAVQHATAYIPLNIRNSLVPVANFGSTLAWPLAIFGLIAGIPDLISIGIVVFTAAVLFQVVTLPVEYNASRRAMAMLVDGQYITPSEAKHTRSVLNAAALTYVAALAVAVANLLRLFMLRGMARDD
jgi:Zn-dependent membrane protease YugP